MTVEETRMIVIDGVVGCGKSTLSNILVNEWGYELFPEPVINNPILEKFYYDKKRYSFPLQIFFFNKRFDLIQQASKHNKPIMDRSVYGDYIFAKNLFKEGNMSQEEFDIYENLFQNMIAFCHPPKLLVYLEISTDEAMKRIQLRGRDFEQKVERDYWDQLNVLYREYFNHEYKFSNIVKINVDGIDFEHNEKDKKIVLEQIKKALY